MSNKTVNKVVKFNADKIRKVCGKYFKQKREAKALSEEQVATFLSLDLPTYQMFEAGTKDISLEHLFLLSLSYNIRPSSLLMELGTIIDN